MPVPRRQRAWLSTDSGAYVASVVEDGPAAKAGIQEGDVITKLDDDEITSGSRAECWCKGPLPWL